MIHALVVALVTLSWSCGPRIAVAPTEVQAARELIDECGDTITIAHDGVEIIEDNEALNRHNHAQKSCAVGLHFGSMIALLPVGEWTPCYADGEHWTSEVGISAAGQKLNVAHELGHAAGLPDTTTGGLMTHFDKSCLHRECECLRKELRR